MPNPGTTLCKRSRIVAALSLALIVAGVSASEAELVEAGTTQSAGPQAAPGQLTDAERREAAKKELEA
jgi:hypothetical protein